MTSHPLAAIMGNRNCDIHSRKLSFFNINANLFHFCVVVPIPPTLYQTAGNAVDNTLHIQSPGG